LSANLNPARAFYDRISGAYDLIADAGEHRARERGLELLAVAPGEHVLEIGYGTGQALVALAEATGAGGFVAGVDLSEGMRRVASKRLREAGLESRVSISCDEVPSLPFGDSRFDAVSLSFTLELFPMERIPEVLREIQRVLRPDGRVGIVSMATVLPGERDSPLEATYKWMHQHFPHIVDCRPIDMERHVREAGFETLESERLSLFTMPVAIVVGRKIARVGL
jgi:ubiquinone/menaquinone biosynthesis C-methylase UbiE